ncbi:MOSC domain-containing protein [Rostrohypoxylon terebratum]|nr:MOSC domain-containing protein [Rostrohypoxylon terebratum]
MGQPRIQITELYIYPIKALRPLSVPTAQLRREGLKYDRRFMLLKVEADGQYTNIQTASFPECTLFSQTIDGDHIVVTYQIPAVPLVSPTPEQRTPLRVPLDPEYDEHADEVPINLYGSATTAYRVWGPYSDWFASCLGYPTVLVYIGSNRRRVLAHAPPAPPRPTKSWYARIASRIPFTSEWPPSDDEVDEADGDDDGGLTFNEAAPFLVTSKASLRDVSARLPPGQEMDMIKFRPNIVVDVVPDHSPPSPPSAPISGDSEGEDHPTNLTAWDEDFWSELLIGGTHRLALTANCARCISINIDYGTGCPGTDESGSILKKLMRDRRVDTGNKWSPIFGRYAFLLPPTTNTTAMNGPSDSKEPYDASSLLGLVADVAVGDEVKVTRRISSRDVWAWPK